jgi:tungstate transport system substrate-binding protein
MMTQRHPYYNILIVLCILIISLVACSKETVPEDPDVILATTTSTQDSGLLDILVPDFEAKNNYVIKTVAVGTGQALEMGRKGDADVLFVHAPAAEKEFMDGGYGSERFLIMHNDFVIVGPANDPAGIKGSTSAGEALATIASSGSTFVSRGDDSGTNKKELALWKATGITPEGEWYKESGQGMAATLKITSELSGYTLTDRATYLHNMKVLDLDILAEGDPALMNIYHVILVNPEKWPHINKSGARAFAEYLVSHETQTLIGEYGIDEFGQPLFYPDADKTDADMGLE